MSAERDAVVTLADGRRLGYAAYGDPNGYPVLNCHGGLLSRLDTAGADADARELGLRVISPDRPGVGLSDRRPGHSAVDWARDAEELLGHLQVDRLSCLGWSMGGQYALAVAFHLPERVTRAAIVAACLPLDDPARRAELSRFDLVLGRVSVRSRHAGQAMVAGLRLLARRLERKNGFPEGSMAEGLRSSSGVVDEYRAFFAPWGFRPEDVVVPTDVWQGTADKLVPPSWGEELARRLRAGNLVSVDGGDHMIGISRRGAILRSLVS